MKDCIKEYLLDIEIKGFSKSTIKNKRNALNQFAEWFEDGDVEEVRPIHIKQYIQHQMDKDVQPVTINYYLKQLKHSFCGVKRANKAL